MSVGPEIVSFSAFRYDPKFCALEERVRIHPEISNGELLYRVPKHHTLIVPPDGIPPGYKLVFLEKTQSWLTVSDHRGEWWLDELGKPKLIERLGNPELWGYRRMGNGWEVAS